MRFEGPLRVRFLHGLSYNRKQKMCFRIEYIKPFWVYKDLLTTILLGEISNGLFVLREKKAIPS